MSFSENFKQAFEVVKKLEFSSKSNALHHNKGEETPTYMGIYEKSWPKWEGWQIINKELIAQGGDLKKASEILYSNTALTDMVGQFYYDNFWLPIKGEAIDSVEKAGVIFSMAVNAGIKPGCKLAQKACNKATNANLVVDGILGAKSIAAINSCATKSFVEVYVSVQKDYYNSLIANNSKFEQFRKGWMYRADSMISTWNLA